MLTGGFLVAAAAPRAGAAEIAAQWILPANTTWFNGSWYDATNWLNGIVPVTNSGNSYAVTINTQPPPNSYVQCSLDGDMTVSRLTLGDVLYTYNSTNSVVSYSRRQFRIQNEFHWVGGSLDGFVTDYHLYGPAYFEGNTQKSLDGECNLHIHDHATWLDGTLAWKQYGSVIIYAGAVLDMNVGGVVGTSASTDSASITNLGTMRMNAAGQTATFYGQTLNTGLLDIQAGDVQFQYGFQSGGNIHIAGGSKLLVSRNGSWKPFTFTGDGEIDMVDGQNIVQDITVPCFLRIAGDVVGAGLTVRNGLWGGGQLSGPGLLTIQSGGLFVISNTTPFLNRNINNLGTLRLLPGSSLSGYSSAALTNAASGTMQLSGGSAQYSVQLINAGQILKNDGSAGSFSFNNWVQNDGSALCTAGALNFAGGGTNTGVMTAQSAGSIVAQGIDFGDSSQLAGDGSMTLAGCTLRGSVSPDLAMTLNSVRVYSNQTYSFKSLQVGSWITFPTNWGADVISGLKLNGSLWVGNLRSLSTAELSFANSSLLPPATLDLAGQSAWIAGALTVQSSNSVFINRGNLRVESAGGLAAPAGGLFVNQGTCVFSRQIENVTAALDKLSFQWNITNISGNPTLDNGPCQISGPVTAAAQYLTAGPGANIVFNYFGATNATVSLTQSSLQAITSLACSNVTLVLDRSTVISPPQPWVGSATLSGNGSLDGLLSVQTLQLSAVAGSNGLALNGALGFTGANPVLRVTALSSNNASIFPRLAVHGPVLLAGKLDLAIPFLPSGSNFIAGPLTLLESDQPLAGGFTNLASGATVNLTNGWRCQVYFGPDSPYGSSNVVLCSFGSAFDQWRMQKFTAEELANPQVSSPAADPDGNGYSNIAEYVLAIDSTGAVPTLAPGIDGYTRIYLERRKDIGNLQPYLAVSTDLRAWASVLLGSTSSSLNLHRAYDFGDHYQYEYLYFGTPPQLFLKVSVSGQP